MIRYLVRVRWAWRLLRAKYFVVLTDKASCFMLDVADPSLESDKLALHAQTAELQMFKNALDEAIKQHQEAVDNLTGGVHVRVSRTKKTNAKRR
jgi:hypothetical protein